MSNKYSLPYDIRMECIAYVRGYPRRVRAYNAAREEVLESSAYAMSGMPHGPGDSRIAERKVERLATIESWPETKKMRAVEYAMDNVGRDIANENVRRKLVWAIMRNCDSQKQYPIEMIATATQVISENSTMFRTIKKHEIVLEQALVELCRILLRLGNTAMNAGLDENVEISIDFDDSIIEDKQTDFSRDMQLLQAGIMNDWEFRMRWMNEDEATAKAALPKMQDMTAERQQEVE